LLILVYFHDQFFHLLKISPSLPSFIPQNFLRIASFFPNICPNGDHHLFFSWLIDFIIEFRDLVFRSSSGVKPIVFSMVPDIEHSKYYPPSFFYAMIHGKWNNLPITGWMVTQSRLKSHFQDSDNSYLADQSRKFKIGEITVI
jgi:hypothetical protein